MKWPVKLLVALIALGLAGLFGAVIFGTSPPPAELTSISAPFKSVDFSDVPAHKTLAVKHGSPIAYRQYGTGEKGAVIAIHGSSGQSVSLHPLAKALAAGGFAVYVPDIRGHGATGIRGDVDFLHQPDMDLMVLMLKVREEQRGKPLTLMGFSLGGGFLIRFVGAHSNLQPDNLVLLAPALGPDAPTMRGQDSGRWAAAHVPRFVGLTILNYLGFTSLNALETIRFAVPPNSEKHQTAAYSYRLHASLLPLRYKASLEKIKAPLHVLSGEKDELFNPELMRAALAGTNPKLTLTIVPGVDHVGLTLDPAALAAIVAKTGTTP